MRPAIFIDRDGTIIEQVHYLSDPAKVRLIPGAADAIGLLKSIGFVCVVVTNQSAIGRGLLTVEMLNRIHEEMHLQLREGGVQLDAVYHCPVAPEVSDRTTVEHPDRKPGPGMVLRAAGEMGLSIAGSWMIGDMLSDMLCGRNAGCGGTILVRTGNGIDVAADHMAVDYAADDLFAAARLIASEKALFRVKQGSSSHARS